MTDESRTAQVFPRLDSRVRPRTVYRVLAVVGTLLATGLALAAVTLEGWTIELLAVPFSTDASGAVAAEHGAMLALTATVTVVAMAPLCKPEPRRILDTVTRTMRGLLVVVAVVATVTYFAGIEGPPRAVVAGYVGLLAVALPPWFVALQEWQLKRNAGTLIVGNNPDRLEAAVQAADEPIVGYAFSPTDDRGPEGRRLGTDGGRHQMPPKLAQFECLGGLTRLDDILERTNVGTVIPALPQTDRAEFFGVLETCHEHDVNVEILDEHNESVLVEEEGTATAEQAQRLIGINMEPLDLQNRIVKRGFDVCFAAVGLLLSLPVIALVALAITVDSHGPVFYTQRRTTQFGDTFSVYKFRTMRPESESATPGVEHDRVTRVGRYLRLTHLDELPQLWTILTGEMSVVGPRAAWTEEEEVLQHEMKTWKKRWFVKPGLTGLAQINEVSSENSRAKLQYDLTYIRNQSFWFDLKIIVRQLWMVCRDVIALIRQRA